MIELTRGRVNVIDFKTNSLGEKVKEGFRKSEVEKNPPRDSFTFLFGCEWMNEFEKESKKLHQLSQVYLLLTIME